MDDHEDLPEPHRPDDFLSILTEKICSFDWALLFAVVISYLIIVSSLYNEKILSKINGAIDSSGEIKSYGYIVQLASLVVLSVIFRIILSMSKI